MNIAMWSGPRNLSTALMYAFAQRTDTSVRDEPFYAAYLAATGAEHPMAQEIIAQYPTNAAEVAAQCGAPAPEGTPHLYLKLMAHHMIAGFDRGFMAQCRNVFLIRHPARVLASYVAKRERPTLEDTGAHALRTLYFEARDLGQQPIVVDGSDIRADPEGMLRALCRAIGLAFDPAMLTWPAGGHPADGVWAAHWYGAVHRSTGFAGPESAMPVLPGDLEALARAALPAYEDLWKRRLRPDSTRS